ncbi:signal recognition particle 72 kDa protein (SRP72) [Anopheles sinensis]|uniref:Signal recognition particle 72 kDa protein (SRP72) n=1 Tax=Anopheles sinensis TaxID=74873 RepID=A0A084W628_ANOSI|nr:signal recognition particle 72 kDa protein (SRP72) [Anopheles sinensis]
MVTPFSYQRRGQEKDPTEWHSKEEDPLHGVLAQNPNNQTGQAGTAAQWWPWLSILPAKRPKAKPPAPVEARRPKFETESRTMPIPKCGQGEGKETKKKWNTLMLRVA